MPTKHTPEDLKFSNMFAEWKRVRKETFERFLEKEFVYDSEKDFRKWIWSAIHGDHY